MGVNPIMNGRQTVTLAEYRRLEESGGITRPLTDRPMSRRTSPAVITDALPTAPKAKKVRK